MVNEDAHSVSAVAVQPPPEGYEVFSPKTPTKPRAVKPTPPLHVSSITGAKRVRGEFLSGAKLLGLDTARKPIQPQQFVVADAIQAQKPNGVPVNTVVSVCIPRRASKTTSVWAVVLGRMEAREDYQVGFTAQTQVKARARWLLDVVKPLERAYPDPKTSPWFINRAVGSSFVEYKPNGSRLSILPPNPEAFRGDGFDMVIIDEAQEVDGGDESDDLVAGILPVFDTRTIDGEPAGQLVLMGTAGPHRSGVFWRYLELGRQGAPGRGIVEYAADPETPIWEEGQPIAGTTADPKVWKSAHPGIGGLTPEVTVAQRFTDMTPQNFAQEYLGLWPLGMDSRFINSANWSSCALPFSDKPTPPDHFTIGVSVHMEGTSAAIVAAWRVDGMAYGAVLDHRAGVRWVAQKITELHRKYGKAVVYDKDLNVVAVEIAKVQQAKIPRLKLIPRTWADVSTAAALIYKEIGDQNLRHYSQPMLDAAVAFAVKRGTPNSKRWAFGRGSSPENDITPLEALSIALHAYDELKPRAALRPPGAAA